MTSPGDPWKPDLGDRVSKLPGLKLGGAFSTPVVARAEQLCDLVDKADGLRPDRQTLMSALVHAAEPDGYRLASIWQEFRTAAVHEFLIGEYSTRGPIDLSIYKKR